MGQPREAQEERNFGRLPLGITAWLDTLDGRKQVRLVDLSQGGAHVVLPHDMGVRDCVLSWLEFEAFGIVAWHKGGHLGLEFEEPLPIATLVATRNVAPEVIREESLAIQSAARDWVDGRTNLGVDR